MPYSLHTFFYLDKNCSQVDDTSIPISFQRDRTTLQNSIDMYGIFTPILVRKNPLLSGGWQIISGQGRWQCSKIASIPSLEILCNDEEALLLFVQDNLLRGFNIIEISCIIQRLQNQLSWPLQKISQFATQYLGLSSGTKILQDHLALLTLPIEVQNILARDNTPLKTALLLTHFAHNEAIMLIHLSQIMRWNANKQREVFTLLWEICRRDQTNILEILQRPDIETFTQAENPSRFAEELRSHIQDIKNPCSSATQQEFQDLLHSITWPTFVQIQPSPNFEQSKVHFEFDVTNLAQYQEIISKLENFESYLEKILRLGTYEG